MQGQADFFLALARAAEAAVKSGKKLEDIVTMKNGHPAATSVKLPDSVKNWVGDGLAAQVADAYNEATQHKPAGDLKH
jgi:hypothetical protein